MRASLAIVLIAGVLLGLALLWMPRASQSPAPQAESEALPAEPPIGEPAAPAAPAPEPRAQALPAEPEPAEPAPDEVAQVIPHPSTPEYAARLAQRFEVDPPDVDSALERDLATRVKAHLRPGSRIDSIECRQMLCRVRSLHADKQTYEAYIASAFADDPNTRLWHGQGWIAAPDESKSQTGARIESVIYLQRDPNPAQ